jgi:hypothetical protein
MQVHVNARPRIPFPGEDSGQMIKQGTSFSIQWWWWKQNDSEHHGAKAV